MVEFVGFVLMIKIFVVILVMVSFSGYLVGCFLGDVELGKVVV